MFRFALIAMLFCGMAYADPPDFSALVLGNESLPKMELPRPRTCYSTYADARLNALRYGKNLVVFVNTPCIPLDDVVCCEVGSFPYSRATAVVVGRLNDERTDFDRGADLSASATASDIRA